jgi:hypothetical protein
MSTAVSERRAHPRRGIALPATVTRVGGRAIEGSGSTVDLSEGGAHISGVKGFSVGDVVVVTINGDGLVVTNQGLVVGAAGSAVHVAFKSLNEDAVIDLRRLLALGAPESTQG